LKIIRDKHVNVTINVKSLSMRSLITRETEGRMWWRPTGRASSCFIHFVDTERQEAGYIHKRAVSACDTAVNRQLSRYLFTYTVSQKSKQNYFCYRSNFHQTWKFLA